MDEEYLASREKPWKQIEGLRCARSPFSTVKFLRENRTPTAREFAGCVLGNFWWEEMPEGNEFWNDVHDQAEGGHINPVGLALVRYYYNKVHQ